MNYHNVHPISKTNAEDLFSSKDIDLICNAMVSVAFYESDWKWAQDKFLDLFNNKNTSISGLAATCLGHIARIHRKIEKNKVLNILKSRMDEIEISGQISDAIDDIEMFS